jgi:hypothetical protein
MQAKKDLSQLEGGELLEYLTFANEPKMTVWGSQVGSPDRHLVNQLKNSIQRVWNKQDTAIWSFMPGETGM